MCYILVMTSCLSLDYYWYDAVLKQVIPPGSHNSQVHCSCYLDRQGIPAHQLYCCYLHWCTPCMMISQCKGGLAGRKLRKIMTAFSRCVLIWLGLCLLNTPRPPSSVNLPQQRPWLTFEGIHSELHSPGVTNMYVHSRHISYIYLLDIMHYIYIYILWYLFVMDAYYSHTSPIVQINICFY